jgi:hypothetical protein
MSEEQKLVLRLSDVPPAAVSWLWPSLLAGGKLHLIDGDPSLGKSLVSLDLAARFTTARELPDGYRPSKPLGVILLGSEDGVQDTLVPRLQAAGAELRRVHIFRGHLNKEGVLHRLPTFPDDCRLLRETIEETRARLVVIDPLMAFLSAGYCSINDQMVRQALTPLAAVAEETGAAVLLIRHLNKGGGGQKAIYRGSGSIGIVAASRIAFLAGRDPEEADLRVLACTKNNLAPYPPSLAYRIATDDKGRPVVRWQGPIDLTADDLVTAPAQKPGEALQRAIDFLRETLVKGGWAEVVVRKARGLGIADRTLERAKVKLGALCKQIRVEGKNAWWWYLQPETPPPSSDTATLKELIDGMAERGLLKDSANGRSAIGPGSDRL